MTETGRKSEAQSCNDIVVTIPNINSLYMTNMILVWSEGLTLSEKTIATGTGYVGEERIEELVTASGC